MRRGLVVGNWKMNPPRAADATALAAALRDRIEIPDGVDVVVCPPAVWLPRVRGVLAGSGIGVGAQTMHWADAGAHTGETSPAMLVDASDPGAGPLAGHVIIGHSERRQSDGETDETVALKVAAALEHGLVPIAAIGERLDEREAGLVEAVIDRQLRAAVSRVGELGERGMAVAYEPVWAIGTGRAASADDAQAVAALVRSALADALGRDAAGAIPILYGGSVTADNAVDFFSRSDIDGALVGGACLRADEFALIVRAAAGAHA